jgi:hypothetical protein
MRRFLSGFLALLLAVSTVCPAGAAFSVNQLSGFGVRQAAAGAVPFSIDYRDSSLVVSAGATQTHTGVDIGAAGADRIVVVGVIGTGTTNSSTITGATIAGITATQVAGADVSAAGASGQLAVIYAPVPTGTTGTIAVTFSGTKARSAISVWAVYGSTGTHTDADESQGSAVSSRALSALTVPAGGAGILFSGTSNDATTSVAWTNATERADAVMSGGRYSSADTTTAGTNTLTATYTGTAPAQMFLAGLAFSP